PRGRTRVADVVGGEYLAHAVGRGLLVAGVDLREQLARADLVPALAAADDADGVVDRVLLRPAARAQVQGRPADLDGPEPRHVPGVRRLHLRDEGRTREHVLARVSALRADPAFVRADGRAVAEPRLRAPQSLGFVAGGVGGRRPVR